MSFLADSGNVRLTRDLVIPRQMASRRSSTGSSNGQRKTAKATPASRSWGLFALRPVVIDALVQRGEFLPPTRVPGEFAQGTLQAIFEFQTMIAELTGMDLRMLDV